MGSAPSLAAIVSVYNEKDFLSQFLMYYLLECNHIFIFDNESSDGSVEEAVDGHPDVTVKRYSTGGRFDTTLKQNELMKKKEQCIGKFDYVMILDCDEFVVPKDGRSIRENLDGRPIYGTQGINMYGYPEDAPYDKAVPLIRQRRRGIGNSHYSKPIVVKPEYRVTYAPGCHYAMNESAPQICPPDAALFYILHYRGFDEEAYVRRSMEWTGRIDIRNPVDGPSKGGYYWRGDPDSFRGKYRYEREAGQPFVLPEHVKGHF